ncbi:MAG TPA: hypothetical protein VFL80_10880, partial [Thermoanaerobaculia bacterium]|nr:hypothetical protein [Thermoanaerobaculia bacterium]
AWYTGAESKGQVYVAFSSDGGSTFGRTVRVDGGAPVGRVDVAWTGAETATVVWIEGVGEAAQIVARTVTPKASMGPITRIGSSSAARAAGFPRMAVAGGVTYVAWTETSTPKRIRIAKIAP